MFSGGLAIVGTLLLGACSEVASNGSTTAVQARHAWTVPDTLRIGTTASIERLNPILGTITVDAALSRLYTDILVTNDAQGHLVPDLAVAVPTTQNGGISRDGLTVRYTLRDGVRWQDGKPFTSADVKFTVDAVNDPNNDVTDRIGYDDIARTEVPDARTVVFHLKRPFAPFVTSVLGEAGQPFGVLPAHLLAKAKNLNDVPFNALPIGTGPFRVVRWERNNQIVLQRNADYFAGKPKLKTVIIKFIPDENTAMTQLRTHEIDWMFEATVTAYHALQQVSRDDVRFVLTPQNASEAVFFNTARGPTKDIRVRRAIVLALDKAGLTRRLTFGTADVATEDLPSFMWAYDRTLRPTPYDPRRAKALLAAAGYGPTHRLTLELYYDIAESLPKALALQIQSALAALDIDVQTHGQVTSIIFGSYGTNGTMARGHYDLAVSPWYWGIDPDNSGSFACSQVPPGGFNDSYFCDPAMDAQQKIALGSYDEATRKAAYARIEHIVEDRAPMDFLWWPKSIQAINPDLHGVAPNPVVETWNAWQWSI